ncbi:hypothetical protein QBC46DRAFT_439895 [Diplogelasinospora grovesii]|uniref:Uncharacterized protein n=1 Tax=Diplogelasinospora grovesii TaxID=303347 RepID=A0AAN6N791_9PEZI|nr:hypothetical protein QBC46DRAFT_439895 [Diplogelasinospora grovesii]
MTTVHSKISRWIDQIAGFDTQFHHRPNTDKIIAIADGMSRLSPKLQDEPTRDLDGGAQLEIGNPGTAPGWRKRAMTALRVDQLHRKPSDRLGGDPDGETVGSEQDQKLRHGRGDSLDNRTSTGQRAAAAMVIRPFETDQHHGLGAMARYLAEPWYADVTAWLVRGDESLEGLSSVRKRAVKRKAINFRILDDRLYRTELDESLAL